jgi:hypothetical protein
MVPCVLAMLSCTIQFLDAEIIGTARTQMVDMNATLLGIFHVPESYAYRHLEPGQSMHPVARHGLVQYD